MGVLQIFTLLGALGMFLYGMNLMSSGLQKAAGEKLRGFLSAMTSNPFKGVMTGLGITTVIQSSSASTVIDTRRNPSSSPRNIASRRCDDIRPTGSCHS